MTNPIVDQERLSELRQVLGKIPGSNRLPWHLQIFDLIDGKEVLTRTIDIRSGRAVPKKKRRTGD